MKILILGFNLYKGGSLQINNLLLYSFLNYKFQKNSFILLLSADTKIDEELKNNDHIKIITIQYPIKNKYLNILYRLYYEQIYPLILNIRYKCDRTILFNNIPILLLRGKQQSVYFHNVNYLRQFSFQQIYFRILIKLKVRSVFFVQSSVVKNELADFFKGQIIIAKHPWRAYYLELLNKAAVKNLKARRIEPNSFLYPAFYYPHKNHSLLKEYEQVFENNNLTIYLTIGDEDYSNLFGNSKSIKNLGKLENIEILLILQGVKGLINVSLNESFMIPIVESMILKKPVLSIRKEYSHFLLVEKGLFFDDADSLNKILSSNRIHEVVEYSMNHIDCTCDHFINQFTL